MAPTRAAGWQENECDCSGLQDAELAVFARSGGFLPPRNGDPLPSRSGLYALAVRRWIPTLGSQGQLLVYQ